jgi:hypothetical protein
VDVRAYHCNWNICKKYLGPCSDKGYTTYVSSITDKYLRQRMLQEYRDSGHDSTNPDNVEDFYFIRFITGLLNAATLGIFNL